MNVLKAYFDESVEQRSPVRKDFNRIVKYDADGNEVITYEEMDYPSFQKSLGKAINWRLEELLKAGINPDFPISTGSVTRLEGVDSVAKFAVEADAILSEISDNN